MNELAKILQRMTALQKEYDGKAMPQNVGEEYERLGAEAMVLQKSAARAAEVKQLEQYARETPDAILPAAPGNTGDVEQKAAAPAQHIAGYITPGELFAASPEFAQYKAAGMPMSGSGAVCAEQFVRDRDGRVFVPLSVEERKHVERAIERKAIPVLGAGVIEPQRMAATPAPVFGFRRLRDVVNVARTTSNAVDFIYRSSHTNAAAVVAEGAVKPEGASAYSRQTAGVKTIAEWIPVTEQQLEDVPQVINLVNTDLLADLEDTLEFEIGYGPGTGEHFLGLAVDPAVVAARTPAGSPTMLDRVRAAITDVRVSRYQANAILIHPYDAEAVETLKGTDGRYVYSVATEAGVSRLWGVPMIETTAVADAAGTTRNMFIGDFQRGATLWIRSDATIAMGWINDQFIRNMRTIRAEMRAAFAVRAGGAIRKIVTATP